MVGKEAKRTYGRLIAAGLGGILASVVGATPILAHPHDTPDMSQCQALPKLNEGEETLESRDKPIALPGEWSDFAASSMYWLAIRSNTGTTHCIDMSWVIIASNYEHFGERFSGFDWTGYEADGYVLIDKGWTGADLETGARPSFSPDGNRFASIQLSDAGWGGLEGFIVYAVHPQSLTPLHVDTAIRFMQDWRIDNWQGNDCIHLSAIEEGQEIIDWDDRESLPRKNFVSGEATGWKLTNGTECPAYG